MHQFRTTADDASLVGELSADGQTIVLIATGPDYVMARMANWLRTLTPAFKTSDPPGALVVPATWPAVVQLAHTFADYWRPGPRLTAWIGEQLVRRTQIPAELTVTLPAGRVPRPYQVEGARMIAATGRALLTDEQGTGKTVTTVLGLLERARVGQVLPVVCVVPGSVVDAWVQTWHDWAPSWRAVAWRGTPAKRRKLAGTADVYVTSFDTARMDAAGPGDPLLALRPAALVVDEVHLIKSPHAARSLAVRRLAKQADVVVGLSGTPITHHPGDLWPTLEALEPAAYPSRTRWVDRYCLKIPGDYGEQVVGLRRSHEPELRACLLGQLRRVAKADVLDQLPPKVYSTRTVELPPAYRKAYDQMESQMLAELPDGGQLSAMSVLAQLTRLAQLAAAAADVTVTVEEGDDGLPRQHVHVRLKAPSWKVDALLEVLAERPGQPVVAFAPSRQLMMLAGKAAEAAGHQVGYIIGGQTVPERSETVAAFQAGKLDLLCVTTQAGGVGLTLTAAGTVVFLQRPWSIVEAIQAEDRCHRIGSEIHDCIEVIDIVAADTIDARVRSVLHDKAGQLADLLQDPRIVRELLGGSARKAQRKKGGKP
ncbi:MAG TPA: DEAD/DEAH box helicase [Trueperaceae bacterium]